MTENWSHLHYILRKVPDPAFPLPLANGRLTAALARKFHALQQVNNVYPQEWDVPLDMVATNETLFKPG